MSFIDSNESDFDSEVEYEPADDEESESISEEASESDIEPVNVFPITVQRKKRVVRFAEFEYY